MPIIRHVDVEEDMLDPQYVNRAKDMGMRFPRKRQLTQTFNGKELLVCTPLLQWYMEQGLVVDKIHSFTEWNRGKVFRPFVDKLVNMRVEATETSNDTLQSLAKITMNSSWGRLAMTVKDREAVAYARESDLEKHKSLFVKSVDQLQSEYPVDLFEIRKHKKSVTDNLPGKFIYKIISINSKIQFIVHSQSFSEANFTCIYLWSS